jgi:hypothetical protein
VSDFVDQCRREWKASASPVHTLKRCFRPDRRPHGSGGGWHVRRRYPRPGRFGSALVRRVVGSRTRAYPGTGQPAGSTRKPLALIVFTAVAATAVVGAVVLLPTGEAQSHPQDGHHDASRLRAIGSPIRTHGGGNQVQASAAASVEWILFLAIAALGFGGRQWSTRSRPRRPMAPTLLEPPKRSRRFSAPTPTAANGTSLHPAQFGGRGAEPRNLEPSGYETFDTRWSAVGFGQVEPEPIMLDHPRSARVGKPWANGQRRGPRLNGICSRSTIRPPVDTTPKARKSSSTFRGPDRPARGEPSHGSGLSARNGCSPGWPGRSLGSRRFG